MAEKMCPGPLNGAVGFREAVCIHTKKVYDQCRSRDCMRDIRVYLPVEDQCFIEGNAISIKPRCAELLSTLMDVEPVAFRRGFYSVDIRFFYKVSVEACTGIGCPRILEGLAVYDKRCILFGSEGGARIFSSQYVPDGADVQLAQRTNLPTAVLEAVDPILLDARVVYPTQPCSCTCGELREVPRAICGCFGQDLALDTSGNQLLVTIGQFSIIKLERDIQLLMPAFDICMPEKDCCDGIGGDSTEDPCEIFSRFDFPVDEFFPPRKEPSCGCGSSSARSSCNSGCSSTNTGSSTSSRCGCNSTASTSTTSHSCGCSSTASTTASHGCGCN